MKLKLYRQGRYFDVQYSLPERPLLPGDVAEAETGAPIAPPRGGRADMSHRLRQLLHPGH